MSTLAVAPSQTANIAIVDDHELIRFGLAQLLVREPGWTICGEASDVASALALIGAHRPTLAIIDLRLSSGDGLELVRQINIRYPEVLTLVSSMHDEDLYAERAIRAGARGFISKQEPADTLIAAIRQVLEGRIYLSPQMSEKLLTQSMGRRSSSPSSPLELLSDREMEVYQWIGRGLSVKEIARELHLSPKTVEYHREHIKEKLQLPSSHAVVRHATAWVLTDCPPQEPDFPRP
ncbi:MAG: response regulator transcription factor [Planctomycetaceae bacterium]|nr:response regulator transcription factor [Planctomycetaceae bacterium]